READDGDTGTALVPRRIFEARYVRMPFQILANGLTQCTGPLPVQDLDLIEVGRTGIVDQAHHLGKRFMGSFAADVESGLGLQAPHGVGARRTRLLRAFLSSSNGPADAGEARQIGPQPRRSERYRRRLILYLQYLGGRRALVQYHAITRADRHGFV